MNATLFHPTYGSTGVPAPLAPMFLSIWRLGIAAFPWRAEPENVSLIFVELCDVTRFLSAIANHLGATAAERFKDPLYAAMLNHRKPESWTWGLKLEDMSRDGAAPSSFAGIVTVQFPQAQHAAVAAALERAASRLGVEDMTVDQYLAKFGDKGFKAD